MAPPKILAVLAAAALSICGATAGPCRPSTTTPVVTPSSTSISTSTTLAPSTTSTSTSTTTTTTTTTTASICEETQVLDNPSFENSGDGWTLNNGFFSTIHPFSGDTDVRFSGDSGEASGSVSTTIDTLAAGTYVLRFLYTIDSIDFPAGTSGLACTISANVAGQSVNGAYTDAGPYYPGWRTGGGYLNVFFGVSAAQLSLTLDCGGDFNSIVVLVDDVTLTTSNCPVEIN